MCFGFWGVLFAILGQHLWHIEVPRLGVESELQLLAYTAAMQDLSRVCNLYYSSWQHQILDPLSEARDQTHEFMVPSWIRFCCATMGTPAFLSMKESKQMEKFPNDISTEIQVTLKSREILYFLGERLKIELVI